MAITKFPLGVSTMGSPITGGTYITTGTVFYVDSASGSNSNTGLDKDNPFAGIDYAINQCTASKGDTIFVMPGHSEDIANGTTIVPDVAGISIIGLGHGPDMPAITYSNAASEIIITGASTYIENINFKTSVTAVVTGVDVDANFVTLEGCRFDYDVALDDFLIGVDIDANDNTTISNCVFRAEPAVGGAANAIRMDDNEFTKILNCLITGDYSDSAIMNEGAAGVTNIIAGNTIYNDDTESAVNAINLEEATTGVIAYNIIGSLYATNVTTTIDPGSCLMIQNFICNAVGEYGINSGPGAASDA